MKVSSSAAFFLTLFALASAQRGSNAGVRDINNGGLRGKQGTNKSAMGSSGARSLNQGGDFNATEVPTSRQVFRNDLFEGDIIPDYESILKAYGPDVAEQLVRTGMVRINQNESNITQRQADINRRWNIRVNGVVQVPYAFSGQHSPEAVATIENAIRELGDRSKVVRFIPRTSEVDYIMIVDGAGCSSFVGKQGGEQPVTLQSDGCVWHGTVQHEFLHALGFNHEQSRPDRDDFVKINAENVIPETLHNFDKRIETDNLGSPYDYGSVMHYPKDAFTVNGLDTITAPQFIGQREAADDVDIHQVVLLYQCLSGARSEEQFLANPCTEDCPCWEGATGCNGNSLACYEGLMCNESNQCIVKAPVVSPTAPPVVAPIPAPLPTPVVSPTAPPVVAPIPAPLPTPVASPTAPPVVAPIPAPLPTPVASPTAPPVVAPIPAPFTTPVVSPTAPPVVAPAWGNGPTSPVGYWGYGPASPVGYYGGYGW